MSQPGNPAPKSPVSHLHAMNLVVALLAGVISITGGIYSLRSNIFAGPAYGGLQGIVRDERIAKPLKLASVEISDLTGAVVNTAATDDDGHYLIEAIKTGNYVVKFTAPLHKVATKTIKIEKDLASTINVDLVPEVPPEKFSSVESSVPVARTIQTPYAAPVATYPAVAPAVPGYDTTGNTSSATAVPSTYSQPDPPFTDSQSSGFRRHPRHRPPGGEYGDTSSPRSQGDAISKVGAQLLQALMSKKSENSSSTS